MSLDKERILSELGSVVNQLMNANCDCSEGNKHNYCRGHGCGGCCARGFYPSSDDINMPCMPSGDSIYNQLGSGINMGHMINNRNANRSMNGINNILADPNNNQALVGMNNPSANQTYGMKNRISNLTDNNQRMLGMDYMLTNTNANRSINGMYNKMDEMAYKTGDFTANQPMGRMDNMMGNPNINQDLTRIDNNLVSNQNAYRTAGGMGYMRANEVKGGCTSSTVGNPYDNEHRGQMENMMNNSNILQSIAGMRNITNKPNNNAAARDVFGYPNFKNSIDQGGRFAEPMIIDAPQSPHGKVGIAPLATNICPGSNVPGNMKMKYDDLIENQEHDKTGNMNMQQQEYGQNIHEFNKMFPEMAQDGEFNPMAIAMQMEALAKSGRMRPEKPQNNTVPPNINQLNQQREIVTHNQLQETIEHPIENQRVSDQINLTNQQNIDHNNGIVTNSLSYQQERIKPNTQNPETFNSPPQQSMIKELIFPVDTSKNSPINYAQPQMYQQHNISELPGKQNIPPNLSAPQTSSKLYNGQDFGVKSTISKTSLMGHKPVGKIPSRNQLQQIYQQFKVSNSSTQQNILKPDQRNSYSDGKLNTAAANQQSCNQIPVEKVAGDSFINNRILRKDEPVNEKIGEVPFINKPQVNAVIDKIPQTKLSRCRNGLQDIVYTAYPSNAAWSFHGEYYPPSNNAARRYRL